jgi:hypothetical protein
MIKTTNRTHYGEVKHVKEAGFFATVTLTEDGKIITRTGFDPDTPQGAIDKAEWSIFRATAPTSEGTERLLEALYK